MAQSFCRNNVNLVKKFKSADNFFFQFCNFWTALRNKACKNVCMHFSWRIAMVFFIPGTDSKIFQGARRVFTFHIEIFSLLSEPTANSVMKRSKCEKWKLFKPLEKFKRKGLGWVICFLRLIEVYLYAIIIISTYQEKLTKLCKMGPETQDPRKQTCS